MLHGLQPRTRAKALCQRLGDARYQLGLRRLERKRPGDYKEYLEGQLRRTLSKRATDPGVGGQLLVQELAARLPVGARVLCVGCRNGFELDRLRALGHEAIGIDLFSQRSDIVVMDMHELSFADRSFDGIYASHSLEHAYDLPRVLAEIARVARDGAVVAAEVPVRHKGSDADLLEFDGLEDVRAALGRIVEDIVFEEELPARSERNGQGSAVARLVFRVQRVPSYEPVRAPAAHAWRTWRRLGAGVVCAAIIALGFFGLGPEALGDWPYNAFGKNSRAHPALHHRQIQHQGAHTDGLPADADLDPSSL